MSKNTDDSLISNVLNNIDVSTYSTEKDLKDMMDSNSQKIDIVQDNINKEINLDINTNTNTSIQPEINNEHININTESQNPKPSFNDSSLIKKSKKKSIKSISKSKIEDDCDEDDIANEDGHNKSVMEISLDSIKNIQRIEETLTRKKIPQFIEFKTYPNVPVISKNKITNVINFKTVDFDFKKEMGKFFQDNGYEQRLIDSYKNDKYDLNTVVKSMEQRLLQFGKLAPIKDIGYEFDGDSDSEQNSNYNLKDGFICDDTVERDEFSDEDEQSFIVEFEPRYNFISGDCLEDLVKFNEKCIVKKSKIIEKKKKNVEKDKLRIEKEEKEAESERKKNDAISKIGRKVITLNLDNSVISDDTVQRELLVSQLEINEKDINNEKQESEGRLVNDKPKPKLKPGRPSKESKINKNISKPKDNNTSINQISDLSMIDDSNNKKSNKSNNNKLDKLGDKNNSNNIPSNNEMHDMSITSSIIFTKENIVHKNDDMQDDNINQEHLNKPGSGDQNKSVRGNNKKTLSSLGNRQSKSRSLIKDKNITKKDKCD